jgi:hypothetical protein
MGAEKVQLLKLNHNINSYNYLMESLAYVASIEKIMRRKVGKSLHS